MVNGYEVKKVNFNGFEMNMVDMTGIDENGFAIDGLAYVNENMSVVDVELIKEKIMDMAEDYCLAEDGKTMDFEDFCDKLWDDYVWNAVLDSGCTDEALEGETRYVMEFEDRVRYIIENEIDSMFISYDDMVGAEINDTPCLDDVDRVANVIKDYVDNYTMSYLDNYGGCVVCVPWDKFNEDDMMMLIEDDVFENCVVDALMQKDIKDVLVYDDGVYVSVDAKMLDQVA